MKNLLIPQKLILVLFVFLSANTIAGHMDIIHQKLQAAGLHDHAYSIKDFMDKYASVSTMLNELHPQPLTAKQEAEIANMALVLLNQRLNDQFFDKLSKMQKRVFKDIYTKTYAKSQQVEDAMFAFFFQIACFQRGVLKEQQAVWQVSIPKVSCYKAWPQLKVSPIPLPIDLLSDFEYSLLKREVPFPVALYLMSTAYPQRKEKMILQALIALSEEEVQSINQWITASFLQNNNAQPLEEHFIGQLHTSLENGQINTFLQQVAQARDSYSKLPAMKETGYSSDITIKKAPRVTHNSLAPLKEEDFQASVSSASLGATALVGNELVSSNEDSDSSSEEEVSDFEIIEVSEIPSAPTNPIVEDIEMGEEVL